MLLALTTLGMTGVEGATETDRVEEDRLPGARSEMPAVVDRYRHLVDRSATVTTADTAEDLGRMLWQAAVADVQAGYPDDRSLYWARLAIRGKLAVGGGTQAALERFERSSRGFPDAGFGKRDASGLPLRVLISGFDPFQLDVSIQQSNPSGLAALSLDGVLLETSRGPALVQSALMPVRFADFDADLVESFFRPHLTAGDPDLVVTISMGRDAFDLERFPGRRRSAAVPDNRNVLSGASAADPRVPLRRGAPLDGPEFVEFSLPSAAMTRIDSPWPVRDNRNVQTLEKGEMVAPSLAALDGLTAVRGSGGGYLSNEISYRAVLLARELGTGTAIGHLHTPRVSGYDADLETAMVAQIRRILGAAVEGLENQ